MKFLLATFVILAALYILAFGPLWLLAARARRRGLKEISLMHIVAMKLRKTPPELLLNVLAQAREAGICLTVQELEGLYITGSNIQAVVDFAARRSAAGSPIAIQRVAELDFAGHDLESMWERSINPDKILADDRSKQKAHTSMRWIGGSRA